jgi:hypothetical protein
VKSTGSAEWGKWKLVEIKTAVNEVEGIRGLPPTLSPLNSLISALPQNLILPYYDKK